MTALQWFTAIAEVLTAIAAMVTAIAAISAAYFAKRELTRASQAAEDAVRLERSKWASHLSERFFGHEFREARETIDGSDDEKLLDWIAKEDEKLTECLNLFELIAYLESSKQIAPAEVQAISGYYLQRLKREPLRNYICAAGKSYEHLEKLLEKV